jgi:hypothetical protein
MSGAGKLDAERRGLCSGKCVTDVHGLERLCSKRHPENSRLTPFVASPCIRVFALPVYALSKPLGSNRSIVGSASQRAVGLARTVFWLARFFQTAPRPTSPPPHSTGPPAGEHPRRPPACPREQRKEWPDEQRSEKVLERTAPVDVGERGVDERQPTPADEERSCSSLNRKARRAGARFRYRLRRFPC